MNPSRRVLFFGTYDVRAHPRVGALIEGFRTAGDDVTECNVPLGLDTSMRVRMLRQPWLLPVLALKLARAWTRLWLRARRLPRPDVVVVGYMGHFDVHLARRLFRRTPIALDHMISAADTAVDRGVSKGRLTRVLEQLDRAALTAADLPFVDTVEHLAIVPDDLRATALVVPVGAPAAWFRAPEPRADGVLRVVFFGLYTPLQGAPVIGQAIAALGDAPVQVTMIGNGQDLAATQAAAGAGAPVTWRSWVPAAELPDVVAAHDVCLGIFGTGPKAHRVVPNKVYQGAAAGCVVVTSDTPPQRTALGDAAVLVPPGDPAALAAALRELAADRTRVEELRRRAYELASARFRPENVVQPLRDSLTTVGAR